MYNERGISISFADQTSDQTDWSLHRKGMRDIDRHKAKIREAVRNNLPDIITEQSFITADSKGKLIKVRLKGMENTHFRFGNPGGDMGMGEGPGNGPNAGDQPGVDYYEAEFDAKEIEDMVLEDFELPNLEQKSTRKLVSEELVFDDIRQKGPFSNLDKRRTLKEAKKRHALLNEPHRTDISTDDLRFKTWNVSTREDSNAVVFAMMDVSGSMGEFEKYVSRAFYYWMVKKLRTEYEKVEVVFIAHHTEAKIVNEQEFFTRGESGGTKASSAYNLALKEVMTNYNPANWNIYPFHFSDGDNWPVDNEACLKTAQELMSFSSAMGYGEVREGNRGNNSTLMSTLNKITDPRYSSVTITEKKDVHPALMQFFSRDIRKEGIVSRV